VDSKEKEERKITNDKCGMTYCPDIGKLVRIDETCVCLYTREGDGQITPSGVSKTEIRNAIGR
jgi:hypothetical protein